MPDGGGSIAATRPQNLRDDTWEQWCVLSESRPYVKFTPHPVTGEIIRQTCLLNEANCRQILENFRRQKDDLPATQRHDKGEALAFHNAMVLVISGAVVDLASHDPELLAPSINDLPGSDRGEVPEDGIYVHRCEVTHLGLERIGTTLKKISPEFHSDYRDSFGERIGYTALGSTYTNYPFLDGNEAQYAQSDWHMESAMDDPTQQPQAVSPEEVAAMMQQAGIGPGDDQQTMAQKFCRMMKMSAPPQAPAAVPGQPAAKPPAAPPTQMETATEPGVGAEAPPPPAAAAAPAPAGGAPTVEPGGKKDEGANGPAGANGGSVSMERVTRLEQLVSAQGNELATYRQRESQRMSNERQTAAQAFAFERGAQGCIQVHPHETEDQALQRVAELHTANPKLAEKNLAKPGSYPAIGHGAMLVEYTRSGIPHGWKEPEAKGARPGERPDEALTRLAREKVKAKGQEGQAFAFSKALEEVRGEYPDLVRRYQTDPGLWSADFRA